MSEVVEAEATIIIPSWRQQQLASTKERYGIEGVKKLETIYRRSNKSRAKEKLAYKVRRKQKLQK